MTYLLFTTAEHGDDAKANRLNAQRRRPIISENTQAYMTVGVDVGMQWNVVPGKSHLWGVKWILWTELKLEFEAFTFVKRSGGSG